MRRNMRQALTTAISGSWVIQNGVINIGDACSHIVICEVSDVYRDTELVVANGR